MSGARYVGRVGALAVALGIGSAVASLPGVAWAAPEPASAADSSHADSPGPSDATSQGGAKDAVGKDANGEKEPDGDDAHEGDGREHAGGQDVAGKDDSDSPAAPLSGASSTEDGDDDDGEGESVVENLATDKSDSGALNSRPTKKRRAHFASAADGPSRSVKQNVRSDSPEDRQVSAEVPATSRTAPQPPAPKATAELQPRVLHEPAVVSLSPVSVSMPPLPTPVRMVLDTLLSPLGRSAGPSGPVSSPVMWVLLGAARRELESIAGGRFANSKGVTTTVGAPPTEETGLASNRTLAATAANQAPTTVADGPFTTKEDTPITLTKAQLVGNDTDPDGDPLSVNSVGTGANGTVVLNSDGSVTFTPTANFAGTASFYYRAKDAAGLKAANTAKVLVNVSPVNDAPVGVNDSFTIVKNAPRTFTVAELVANDADPDAGDVLKVNSVGGPSNGSVKMNADGTVTFTPNANYTGPASFIYRVRDSSGATSTNLTDAKVTLNVVSGVNQAPTTVADGPFTTKKNTAITLTKAQLVGNDTDPDGGPLSVNSVGTGANGTVVLNSDGSVTFTPTANFAGTASFYYRVKDAAGLRAANTAKVTVNVTPVNDAPTAVNDSFTLVKNSPRTLTAAQLLGNDTDPDAGDTLKVISLGGNNHVATKLNADGSVTVTPEAGYTGAASFIYRVQDSAGATSGQSTQDATVMLTIEAAPAGQLTVVDAVTDNYKDVDNGAGHAGRDLRTYMSFRSLRANGVDYVLAVEPGQDQRCLSTDCHPDAGTGVVHLRSADGTKTATARFTTTDPNVKFSLFRVDGASPAMGASTSRFGPFLQLNAPVQPGAPIAGTLILTVDGVDYSTPVEYRYDDAVYNAPPGNIEYNGAGGRWYVAGVATRLNHEPSAL